MKVIPRTTNGPMIEPGLDEVDRLRSALNAAIRGKGEAVEHVLGCLLARGHL
jgi:hypothetical protein